MAAKKELQVSAVENGTVIDHIPAEKLFDVINVLGIQNLENTVTFGYNLISSKLGKKGIIKIWDKFLKDDEINKLALVAPTAKINIIISIGVFGSSTIFTISGKLLIVLARLKKRTTLKRTPITALSGFPPSCSDMPIMLTFPHFLYITVDI